MNIWSEQKKSLSPTEFEPIAAAWEPSTLPHYYNYDAVNSGGSLSLSVANFAHLYSSEDSSILSSVFSSTAVTQQSITQDDPVQISIACIKMLIIGR